MLGKIKSSAVHAAWGLGANIGVFEAIKRAALNQQTNPTTWFTPTRVTLLIGLGAPMLPFRGAKAQKVLEMASVGALFAYVSASYATPVAGKPDANILERLLQRFKLDLTTR